MCGFCQSGILINLSGCLALAHSYQAEDVVFSQNLTKPRFISVWYCPSWVLPSQLSKSYTFVLFAAPLGVSAFVLFSFSHCDGFARQRHRNSSKWVSIHLLGKIGGFGNSDAFLLPKFKKSSLCSSERESKKSK